MTPQYLRKRLKDPEGFTIELISHQFKGEARETVCSSEILGGGAHLNLLTLRTTDIACARTQCERLGMKLLSIQLVDSHGFTLYFYAFTDDVPPSEDPFAVENRPWLYKRCYTVLEIQHLHSAEEIRMPNEKQTGYAGTIISELLSHTYEAKKTDEQKLWESLGIVTQGMPGQPH